MWLDELKRIKEESGKTTEEIAAVSGVPTPTLNKIFAGQTKKPQLETIKAVVYSLGHSLDDLFGGIERKTPSGEAAEIAAAYDRADDKSRKMARLALEDFIERIMPSKAGSPPESKNVHDWTREEMHAEVDRQYDAEEKGTGETSTGSPDVSGADCA